jgi:hypothetical protein
MTKAEILEFTGLTEKQFYKKYKKPEDWEKSSMGKKLMAKSGGSFKAHKMYGPKGEVKTAKTLKEHLALKKKGWGHESPKAQFGSTFGSNFGGVNTNIQGLGDDALQGPEGFGDGSGAGLGDIGNMASAGIGAIGAVMDLDERLKQERNAEDKSKQSLLSTGVGLQASVATANEAKKYKPKLNKFNHPEQFVTTGENLYPVGGVGSNPISKTGGKYKAQDGGTFNGEYMPLVNPNQQKQFSQGGYLKSENGFDISNLQWGAGEYSGMANGITNKLNGPDGTSASGQFAGEALGTIGNKLLPGVGGAIGEFVGENIFNDIGGRVARTRRNDAGAQSNIQAIQNNAGAASLHSGNVATRNGQTFKSYRSGGNMRGDYVSPNPSALDTMKMGGNLKTLWGGEAETVAYNPYSGGESIMFKGNSHETRDTKTAETGIGIAYGDGAMIEPEGNIAENGMSSSVQKIEVEGGEPAFESNDELKIIGDMFVMKELLPLIDDDRVEGKKMKHFVGKDIHGDEIKANKLLINSSKLANDSDSSDLLSIKTAETNKEAAEMIQKKAARTKETLANVQEIQNDLFNYLGADANKFIKTGKLVKDPMRDYNSSLSEMSKNGKIVKAQTGPPTGKSLKLNTLPDDEKVYKSAAEAEKDGYVLNKKTGNYERSVGNKVEEAELEIGANETYKPQSKTDDGLYGDVTMESFEKAKAANSWFDWSGFDPTNKNDVLRYQNEFNKKAEKSGSKVRINPDGYFGNQTQSAMFTPETAGSEPSVEVANIENVETTTTEETTSNPLGLIGNLFNRRKNTKDYSMDPNQISGEIYSLISNREEPVDSRFFTPSLRSPYDISLQAQKNEAIQQNRSMMRNPIFMNNPASAAMASSQTYNQLQEINEREFIANQQMKDTIYSGNLEKIDQAKMMNLGIADQQQDRMIQGRANTRKEKIDALSSISNKQANFERDNRRNKVLANMYPTFGFDDDYQTRVQGTANFNIPGQGTTGYQSLINQLFTQHANKQQDETATAKYGKKVTKNNKNSNILRAIRNL